MSTSVQFLSSTGTPSPSGAAELSQRPNPNDLRSPMDAPPFPPPSRTITSAAGSGGREDCWTEDATEALVEAWGERYLQLSRGNLRQKDWQDVAVAVNEHLDAVGRPRRTDIQCKNRIDTLKKKYKIEKSKRGPSRWRFFERLDFLIAAPAAPALKKHRTSSVKVKTQLLTPLTLKVKNGSNATPNVKAGSHSEGSSSPLSSKSSADEYRADDKDEDEEEEEEEEEDEGDEDDRRIFFRPGMLIPKKRRWDGLVDAGRLGGGDAGMDGAFGELARAIVKFGEIYERVESSKQKQMVELEKQRMELAKELECQRMQMFVELQVGLEKIEKPKFPSRSGEDS